MKKSLISVVLVIAIVLSSVTVIAENESGVTVYVSVNGKIGGNGSFENPFSTVEAAKKYVSTLSKNQPITVVIREGVYYTDETILFNAKDSGSNKYPVTYTAYEDERVVITPSKKLDVSKFKAIDDESVLERIPEEARSYVGQLDLKAQGVTGFGLIYNSAATNAENIKLGDYIDLYLDDVVQMIAQWPNGKMNYDVFYQPELQGPSGASKAGGGQFSTSNSRLARWVTADFEQAYMPGYFSVDYALELNQIAAIDPENLTVTLKWGTQSGVINLKSKRYKVCNLLEELDMPGEWYVDRNTDTLYYYPPYNIEKSTLQIAYKQCPVFTFENTSNLVFENIELFGSANAVSMCICDNIQFLGCTFRGIQSTAFVSPITPEGRRNINGSTMIGYKLKNETSGLYNIVIDSCNFRDINFSALEMNFGDSAYIKHSNSFIRNNMFESCSLVGNSAVIGMEQSCGLTVENNTIHNAKFHGIGYAGMLATIKYNEIYNVTREPYDAGAIYAGRDFAYRENEIAYNIIHDVDSKGEKTGHGTRAIYMDDSISATNVHHNIMWESGAGIHNNAGVSNDICYNIIIGARNGAIEHSATGNRTEAFKGDFIEGMERAMKSTPWLFDAFPELYYEYDYAMEHKDDRMWLSANTVVSYNVSDMPWGWQELSYESFKEKINNVLIDPEKDVSMFVDYKNKDFRLKSGTEFAKQFPEGLTDENFEYSMSGVQISEHRKELPVYNETNSPFLRYWPKNGQAGVDGNDLTFLWEDEPGADRYYVTIATDPEMKNIVKEVVSETNNIKVSDLENNKVYYWVVQAENYSCVTPSKWMCSGVPWAFSTSQYGLIDSSILEIEMNDVENAIKTMVEGEEAGNYKPGSKSILENALNDAKKVIKLAKSQQEIEDARMKLNEIFGIIGNSLYVKDSDISLLFSDNWYKCNLRARPDNISPDLTVDKENETIIFNSTMNNQWIFCSDLLPAGEIHHFKVKFNWADGTRGYFGIGGKTAITWSEIYQESDASKKALYDYPCYLMIAKSNQLEFQRRGSSPEIIETTNNSYIKNGEWVDMTFGNITTLTGNRFIVKVNGHEVFNQNLTKYPLDAGAFAIFCSVAGMSVEVKNDTSFKDTKPYMIENNKSNTDENDENSELVNLSFDEDVLKNENWELNGNTLEKEAEGITIKGIESNSRAATIKSETGKNLIANFDAKFNLENGWQGITMRCQSPHLGISGNNNSYAFIFKKSRIEIQRFYNGTRQYLANLENDGYITSGEYSNIQIGTVDEQNGVRVSLCIDGVVVADVYDASGMYENGSVAFYDNNKNGISIKSPSMPIVTLEKMYTEPYDVKGKVVNNDQSDYTKTGEWSTTGFPGVNGIVALKNDQSTGKAQAEAKAISGARAAKVYYWVGIDPDNGDDTVKITTLSHYDGNNREFTISNKKGTIGWKYLGTVLLSDGNLVVRTEGSGKGNVILGAVKIIDSDEIHQNFTKLLYQNKGAVVMNIGKTTAYKDGQVKYLPSAPEVVNGRTLVPVRFISEAFGAKVSWNDVSKEATIVAQGHTLVFVENSDKYTFDGVEKSLDQPATVVNGRMMVPIRVISEDLGKNVYWEESGSGLIIINDKPVDTSNKIFVEAAKQYYSAL